MAGMIAFGVFQLLQDWQGQDVEGFLMSEKLDGWRCGFFGGKLWTRGGIQFDAPEWFLAGLPDVALDGELFLGRGRLYGMQGAMRDGWHGLSFQVFDAPEYLIPFRKRYAMLKTLSLPSQVAVVKQERCLGTVHLIDAADAVVARGGEGMVVRNPRALYCHGRTDDVLRWVPQCPSVNRRRVAA
jgi:DNA ligase 1